jgi:hydrogenase nickel incorporation protein HypA/HybF
VHEYSLADGIIKTVLSVANENKATKVSRVNVEYGLFSLVEAPQLDFCLGLIAKDTILNDAEFVLERNNGKIKCNECGYEGEPQIAEDDLLRLMMFSCPKCESSRTTILDGRQIIISSIDITTDEE